MKQIKEIRSTENIQVIDNESRTVEGYGVVFDSESVDLGGFTEIISRNAITDEVINNSDILFLLDHNRERGLLARSKNGNGSLKVEIDERGVKYSFEAPHTALGDEVIELLKRGDLSKCSFAFTVAEDNWMKRSDGTILRTIESIDRLYDISIVISPAYSDTEVNVVNKRGLEELEEREAKSDEDEAKTEDEESVDETEKQKEDEAPEDEAEKKSEDEKSDDVESAESDSDEKEETEKDDETSESESDDEQKEDDEVKDEQRNLYIKENSTCRNTTMKKNKFSLIGCLNDVINNRSTDANKQFINGSQIVLPIEERAEGDGGETPAANANGIIVAGVAEQGGQTIDNELWDLMTDLKDKMILNELGAQFITAYNTLEIPRYSAGQAGWCGEIEEAKDAAGKFSSIKLAPLRLSAFMDISNTWLNMTSLNAENILRQELVNCIALKLQQSIFSTSKGDEFTPQGLLYNVKADSTELTYDDVVAMEGALEEANVYGSLKYAVSPSAKSKCRTVKRDAGSGLFVWEKNEIEGIPALSSASLPTKAMVLGDWSQFLIAFFGGSVRLTVDPISLAIKNMTRIVVTLDCNFIAKRPECFVKRILK